VFKSVAKEEIQVPAHIDYLGELRNFVTKSGRKHGFSDTVVNAFKLCIDEAATNIIKHAYRDWEGMIKMRVIVKKGSLTVLLIDQGKFFDPSRVQDPDLQRYVKIGKKGGLGIFIMRKLLDEIEYHKTEEGNELRLTKNRDATKRKSVIPYPTLSFSLKTKYSMIAAAILTSFIVIGYFYFFFQRGGQILNNFVLNEKPICESLARDVFRADDIISKDGENVYQLNAAYIFEKVEESIKGRDEIYRVIVTDIDNIVEYSTDSFLELIPFLLPENIKKPHQDVVSYKNDQNETIYNFFSDVVFNEIKIGTVYLEVKKEYISSQITSARLNDLQLVALILTFGFLGIIVLIYIILNPFRKLANWVQDFGSGAVKDEIDFDTNDEVGEIAKAFTDITDSLRHSQKNLAEQERMQKEMQLAQDIQQALLPTEVPELEQYEIASYYEAAKEVGGDYYDFIEVDKDTLGIVVADVSGKGVPGSLIMTMIRTALRTEARSIKSASEVLARVNDFVVNDMKKGMFVTLFYVIIDSKKRKINYASAGHNPMVLYRQGKKNTYYLNPRGFPVGISLPDPSLFKKSIESDTIQLAEDDILIIYTDGITEAMNNKRELFSEERLQKAIGEFGHLQAQEFVDNLTDEIHSFTEGFEQNDDITLVTIKEKSSPEKIELQRAQKAHQMINNGCNIREACEECGITVYAYYNKYKKIFEEEGIDAIEIDETISVEAKHLSIEEKTKIYDIIKLHPDYGAKRISEELDTERYSHTKINENRIYDELVRSRLNTRQLREGYLSRSGRKKRMKPPGTPMLTLDGKIILDKRFEEYEAVEPMEQEKPVEMPITKSTEINAAEEQVEVEEVITDEPDDSFYLESLMSIPIEDLLKKRRRTRKKRRPALPIKNDLEIETPAPPTKKNKTEKTDPVFEKLLDKPNDESEKEKSSISASEADDLLSNIESTELENVAEDVSFSDIWKEPEEETTTVPDDNEIVNFDIEMEEKKLKIDFENNEQDEQTAIDKISEAPTNLDEILNEAELEYEQSDFEMLVDETSFKDELLNEKKTEIKNKSKENEQAPDEEKSQSSDVVSGQKPTAKESAKHETISKDIQEDEIIKPDQKIIEKEFSEIDFTFSDLLEEIENDIAVYNENGLIENKEKKEITEKNLALASKGDFTPPQKTDLLNENSDNGDNLNKNQIQNKHLLLGLKYYRKGKYKKAVEQFNDVIVKYPYFKEAYSILGNAYYHANMVNEAVEVYKRVKKIDPGDTDSYENTGVIYANQGMLGEAIKEWKMVVKIDPKRKDILNHIEEAKQILKQK
jgi:serine phosphatase RsbU (regulator of sigma subunit)/anti-sigma regulatory factor (Ser/Thr protein kinase)/TolA-binding protein